VLSHFLLSLRERHFGNSLVNEQPKFRELCFQRLAILMLDGTWHMIDGTESQVTRPWQQPLGLICKVTVFIAKRCVAALIKAEVTVAALRE